MLLSGPGFSRAESLSSSSPCVYAGQKMLECSGFLQYIVWSLSQAASLQGTCCSCLSTWVSAGKRQMTLPSPQVSAGQRAQFIPGPWIIAGQRQHDISNSWILKSTEHSFPLCSSTCSTQAGTNFPSMVCS
jgi:hypothetical protein